MHDGYDVDAKQVGTNEMSTAARLDRPTEDRLYRLYREYFQHAETERTWNLWNDVPWDQVRTDPPAELVAAVLEAYRDDLLLPDYSARALSLLRSSRGRAWFLTQWSYEEGKHLLALNEWLVRSGAFADDELRRMSDELLSTCRWEPPFPDAPAVFVDALLWEMRQLEQARSLARLADAAGDPALATLVGRIIADELAHRDFFRATLVTIAEAHRDLVTDAVRRVAEVLDQPGGEKPVLALLDLPSGAP
jgi:acyl-[acyl-carrier-protein] desaturase